MIRQVKGMRDLLPPDTRLWAGVERIARHILDSYGYEEIRTPILEETDLFVRGIGQGTDIVHKEMFTFEDRGGRNLTLRPEMTAAVARAFVEHSFQQKPMPQRYWYVGPMFRHERPQKGRYRQFHQIGAELYGAPGPEGDVEMIAAIFSFLRRLRFEGLVLRLNSVGDAACRPAYVEALRAALRERAARLCADCVRRTDENPLRVLDCKVPGCREVAKELPLPSQHLCEPCRKHAGRLSMLLAELDLPVETDERLVRGLDYYTRTVFEVTAEGLGSQNAILGGGRYDGLVAELGGPQVPAVGFSAGLDRILDVVPPSFREEIAEDAAPRGVVIPIGSECFAAAFRVSESMRDAGLDVAIELNGRKVPNVLSRASKEGVRWAAIVGEAEVAAGTVVLKDLESGEQRTLAASVLEDELDQVQIDEMMDSEEVRQMIEEDLDDDETPEKDEKEDWN